MQVTLTLTRCRWAYLEREGMSKVMSTLTLTLSNPKLEPLPSVTLNSNPNPHKFRSRGHVIWKSRISHGDR
jgi:hypothetical protein